MINTDSPTGAWREKIFIIWNDIFWKGIPALKPAQQKTLKSMYNSHQMYVVDICHDEISLVAIN